MLGMFRRNNTLVLTSWLIFISVGLSSIKKGTTALSLNSSIFSITSEDLDEDYPSDDHGGALQAFSQLASDDSKSSSRSSIKQVESKEDQYDDDDDIDERSHQNEENTKSVSNKIEFGDDEHSSDYSKSIDSKSQYFIEEHYAYSYDVGLNDKDDHSEDFTDHEDE